jgi:hypothetical protein
MKKVTKKSKTPQYNRASPKLTTKVTEVKVLEHYRNTRDWQMYPLTGNKVEDMAIKLVAWARDDQNALKIAQFAAMNDISYDLLRKWAERYEPIKEAYRLALQLIGTRRELVSKSGPIHADLIKLTMHHYDDEYVPMHKFHADLRNNQEEIQGMRLVLMEKFPELPSSQDPEEKK